MKKILFILILCIIKLNAYEYLFYVNDYATSTQSKEYYFIDNSKGNLVIKYIRATGKIGNYTSDSYFYTNLINIRDTKNNYISNNEFINIYKNDLSLLNDFYVQRSQPFLNYLYNLNHFSSSSFIQYDNYELLYNSDGLAVESIVNGIWAGLYDGPDNSGYLYNYKGNLLYKNGVPVSFFEKLNEKLLRKFNINLESIFMKKIFYPLLVLIFGCVIFRAVIRMAVKAFLIRFYDNKIRRLEKRREDIENA